MFGVFICTEHDLVLDSIGLRTPLMDLYRRTPLWRPPVS